MSDKAVAGEVVAEQRFIVAEISQNWQDGVAIAGTPPICVQFEHVIAVNLRRGYRLHSFQLHRLLIEPDGMNETIIAVFERNV